MQTKANQNFVVYKSSAGSGKTFTLVKEYLKLALQHQNNLTKSYKSILAITFTNKAASEMKWRIIKALKEISSESNAFLSQLIAEEIGITTSELKLRAGIVLTDILHHYSDFSIGTIDSFTHRIVRTFALDLKLPINFQIETDSDTVFKKVISTLINHLGKDKLVTDYLIQFSLSQIEDNKNWDPEQTLIEFIKEIHKEGANDLINQLSGYSISDFEKIKKQLKSVISEFDDFLKTNGSRALKLIHEKQLTASSFASGGAGIYNFFVKLNGLKSTSAQDLFGANVNKTLDDDKWYGGKTSISEKATIDSIKHELEIIAKNVKQYLQDNEQRYNVFKLIHKNIYAMGLVNELAKLTNEYKSDENILFISEFNELISEVVNNEPTPFIFERLGDKYNHFLLDEFQDTSAMQWQNMLPLIDNSLANGHLNLIVGDGKQSIYRWRNADVEQFVSLPKINGGYQNTLLLEREKSLVRNFKEEVLGKNFRSESVIVKFNNELFEYLSNNVLTDELKKIYHHQKQQHKPEDSGYVSICFPELGDEDVNVVNNNYTLKYIEMAIADGYQYNDICIIVRKNKHGNLIANYLIEKEIPVVSADSLLLNHANEINVIIAFLKYISNQKDLIAASVIVNYLHKKHYFDEQQSIKYLRELNTGNHKKLYAILTESSLSVDVLKLTSANLFECCLEIITVLKLNDNNPQYVRFFLDEVLSFLQGNTSNISLFLEWWERRSEKASVIIPEGINAVNIMTIHASKGLEFPIVITPYLGWETEKTQSIWIDINEKEIDLPVALINTTKATDNTIYKALAEKERQQQVLDSLNMLYVDFTRAVDRLHIISPKPKKKSIKNCHNWLLSFAETLSHFDASNQILEFGNPIIKDKTNHTKGGLQQLQIKEIALNRNTDVVKIKNSLNYNVTEDLTKAREYGIMVHYILSKIKTKYDVEEVIHQAILSGDVNEAEALKISKDINQLLSIESISGYFDVNTQIKNELEILTESGDILRPDRVIISNNKATVLDYKTGKKNPEKYHSQMREYEKALLNLGYLSVTKILIYIHEQEVEFI